MLLPIVIKAQKTSRNINYFVQEATKYSPLLKDYKNQKQSLKIDSMLIIAAAKPQVTASSAGMYAPIIKGYGYDEALTNGQSLEALLNVNYDLLNKKKINNQLQGIKLQSDSITYAGALSTFDLNKSIIDQYITVYASQQDVKFNLDVFKLLKKEETLLKELTRNNFYKQSEYLTFLVTLQQQQLTLKQAELQYQSDYATLNYLSGVTDTTVIALEEPQLGNPILPTETGFFTKRFDIDSLKYINQKEAIDLNYKPKLGVYANTGYNSSFILQPYKNFGASVGFTLSIPIYDGHQKKMQYDKLGFSTLTSSYYKDFFIRQQKQQLYMLSKQISNMDQLFAQINEQIRFAKGLIDVNSKLLHTGDVKVADYIIAINNYMSAQNLLRQTNINRMKLINQFNYWNR
ncbi:TolC family protein [Pedobacter boryungensis]|uniref:TolC family protein n=1 Tax=Pedobacter boryungensis TaxID=869962 RepID=A0ABX2DB98_9SPHI|nr:TolC family protein [Pedobacter boryungensis]NQX31287.1 TolC family protein [Pedobacter boryungensis]